VRVHSFELWQTLEFGHCLRKHLVVACFASACWSDYHETVTYLDGIVELDYFVEERLFRLEVKVLACFQHLGFQLTVVLFGFLGVWEQIKDNVFEEGEIVFKELGDIHVS